MPPIITLLAGAPFRTDLNWDEEQLTSVLGPEFVRITDFPDAYIDLDSPRIAADQAKVKWRVVTIKDKNGDDNSDGSARIKEPEGESVVIVRDFADPKLQSANLETTLPVQKSSQSLGLQPIDSRSSPKLLGSHSQSCISSVNEDRSAAILSSDRNQLQHVPISGSQADRSEPPSSVPVSDQGQDEQYLDHSFAVYEESQAPTSVTTTQSDTDDSIHDHSLASTIDSQDSSTQASFNQVSDTPQPCTTVIFPKDLITLHALPKPSHLTQIYPQTVTASLIAGIISKQPARTIVTKKSSRLMTLIEVLVGDHSGKTMAITFWIRPEHQQSNFPDPFRQRNREEVGLLQTLKEVRNYDLVLFRNVALSTYNGAVRGQTLHPSAKAATSISILGRNTRRWDYLVYAGLGADQALSMVRDVEDWMWRYLPAQFGRDTPSWRSSEVQSSSGSSGRGEEDESSVLLPPDTPRS